MKKSIALSLFLIIGLLASSCDKAAKKYEGSFLVLFNTVTEIVAYTKDEGDAVTMKDVIRQTEKENAEKLARIRAERAARQEAFEKQQASREANRGNYDRPRGKRPFNKEENKPAPVAAPAEEPAKAEAAPAPVTEGENK